MATVSVKCPIPGCDYQTEEENAAIVAALLNAHTLTHTPSHATAKAEKVKRPSIAAAGTSEEWAYFELRWKDYVTATKIEGRDKFIQLLECCDERLRRDLTRTAGSSLSDKTEEEVMAAIRKLAVREENTMVARVKLHGMHQDRDEPVRSFGARLRGQASICKFVIKCPGCDNAVNYTDAILRDVLTKGIADPEIQLDLLGDKNQDMSLEEVFKFVEAKESGKRSASQLLDTHSIEAASSSYRKTKTVKPSIAQDKFEPKTHDHKEKPDACTYCGKPGHGKSAPARVRRNDCPAYGHTCGLCNRLNHYECVCHSKDNPKPAKLKTGHTPPSGAAIFDALCNASDVDCFDSSCTLSDTCIERSLCIDHHVYDKLSDTWVKQHSKSQPFINVAATVSPQDYSALGFRLNIRHPSSAILPAMADTGCQSCLAGLKVIHPLGLRESDLMPVTMQMRTANNLGIKILGATVLRMSAKNPEGKTLETRQMTYITDTSDKLFLSREACSALGIINDTFPTVGSEFNQHTHITSALHEQPKVCDCPKRTSPPPPPTSLPCPATDENLPRLRDFLLDHYKSSTFNTCEHQPLPLMDVPPMKLMVDPDAEPVAHHTPIPVPIHSWISRHSTSTQHVRHTTLLHPFTRPGQSHIIKGRRFSMPGMGTIVYPSTEPIGTLPHL